MNPPFPGRYLILVYDWSGILNEKPAQPEWQIQTWSNGKWSANPQYWDNGGYRQFEVIEWRHLPNTPLSPTQLA